MRRTLGFFVLGLITTFAAIAEGRGLAKPEDHDDHDDKQPVQSGYAVITPSVPGANGLVAFETFGMRGEGGATQAGVLPAGLTTNAVLFVESSGRLSKNLGVAIVNPNSGTLTVNMSLNKSDGTQVATTSVMVPSLHQMSEFVTELFPTTASVPSDFTGLLTLTSSGSPAPPFSVVGLRFRGKNFSTIPVTSLSTPTTGLPVIATGVGGDGAILLSQFTTGGGWETEIVLANTGTSSLTVRVDLFKADGTPLSAALNDKTASSFTDLKIPAGGVIELAPRDSEGDDDF